MKGAHLASPFAKLGGFSVRKAKGNETELCLWLMSRLFPLSRTRLLYDDFFLIAEKRGKPAGFCHFRLKGQKCYIAGLGVLPRYRNHGVGSLLLSRALAIADAHGAQAAALKVRALNPASNIYAKFGFFERKSGEMLVLVRKKPS